MSSDIVAMEVTGELVNQNEVILSTGEFDRRAHATRSYSYPRGAGYQRRLQSRL